MRACVSEGDPQQVTVARFDSGCQLTQREEKWRMKALFSNRTLDVANATFFVDYSAPQCVHSLIHYKL